MHPYVVQQVIESIYNAIPVAGIAHNYLSQLKMLDIIGALKMWRNIYNPFHKSLFVSLSSHKLDTLLFGADIVIVILTPIRHVQLN